MPSPDLVRLRPALRFGLPALAAGQGLSEAGFILAAKQGLSGGGPLVLVALAACVLLRFVFQDRSGALEARALFEASKQARDRLLRALRDRAVPAYRPEHRRALEHALEESLPRATEGVLARRGLEGALVQCTVLVPMLFLLSWKTAAVGLAAAAVAWPVLRWRNRKLKALEGARLAAVESARRMRADFESALEGSFGGALPSLVDALGRDLDAGGSVQHDWRLARSRYPAVLETGMFFVLVGVLMAGAFTLQGWDAWLLFTALLVLTWRPVREAARHFPLALQGKRAQADLAALLARWEAHPPRALPPTHSEGDFALRKVDFTYGNHPVFRDFSLTLKADRITAISGPNGAGKTTLLRLLAGAEIPEAGSVEWSAEAKRKGVAYLPQRAHPVNWSDWAKATKTQTPDTWAALDALLRLEKLIDRAAHPESLSGGERQRMALAQVLASDAAYLLLDEPATALPGDERERVLAGALALWRSKGGRGAAVVSHEPFIDRLCDARVRLDAQGLAEILEAKPEGDHA